MLWFFPLDTMFFRFMTTFFHFITIFMVIWDREEARIEFLPQSVYRFSRGSRLGPTLRILESTEVRSWTRSTGRNCLLLIAKFPSQHVKMRAKRRARWLVRQVMESRFRAPPRTSKRNWSDRADGWVDLPIDTASGGSCQTAIDTTTPSREGVGKELNVRTRAWLWSMNEMLYIPQQSAGAWCWDLSAYLNIDFYLVDSCIYVLGAWLIEWEKVYTSLSTSKLSGCLLILLGNYLNGSGMKLKNVDVKRFAAVDFYRFIRTFFQKKFLGHFLEKKIMETLFGNIISWKNLSEFFSVKFFRNYIQKSPKNDFFHFITTFFCLIIFFCFIKFHYVTFFRFDTNVFFSLHDNIFPLHNNIYGYMGHLGQGEQRGHVSKLPIGGILPHDRLPPELGQDSSYVLGTRRHLNTANTWQAGEGSHRAERFNRSPGFQAWQKAAPIRPQWSNQLRLAAQTRRHQKNGSAHSKGPLLNGVAHALVVGRLRVGAWITRTVPINADPPPTSADASAQVILNDLARTLTGKRRYDRASCRSLATKSGIQSLNELAVQSAAMAAWHAFNGGPLRDLLTEADPRTRASAAGLLRAAHPTTSATNMARCWNASAELRHSTTSGEARRAASKLASTQSWKNWHDTARRTTALDR